MTRKYDRLVIVSTKAGFFVEHPDGSHTAYQRRGLCRFVREWCHKCAGTDPYSKTPKKEGNIRG